MGLQWIILKTFQLTTTEGAFEFLARETHFPTATKICKDISFKILRDVS